MGKEKSTRSTRSRPYTTGPMGNDAASGAPSAVPVVQNVARYNMRSTNAGGTTHARPAATAPHSNLAPQPFPPSTPASVPASSDVPVMPLPDTPRLLLVTYTIINDPTWNFEKLLDEGWSLELAQFSRSESDGLSAEEFLYPEKWFMPTPKNAKSLASGYARCLFTGCGYTPKDSKVESWRSLHRRHCVDGHKLVVHDRTGKPRKDRKLLRAAAASGKGKGKGTGRGKRASAGAGARTQGGAVDHVYDTAVLAGPSDAPPILHTTYAEGSFDLSDIGWNNSTSTMTSPASLSHYPTPPGPSYQPHYDVSAPPPEPGYSMWPPALPPNRTTGSNGVPKGLPLARALAPVQFAGHFLHLNPDGEVAVRTTVVENYVTIDPALLAN